MKKISKPALILFLFTTIFQLLFVGLYSIWTIYYLPGFNSDIEYYFSSIPTKKELIFSGFKSGYLISESFAISLALVFLACKLKTFNNSKKYFQQVFYASFSWTVLFGALYFISQFAWYTLGANFHSSFSLEIIRLQLSCILLLYFVLAIPIAALLYKHL